VWLAPLDRGGFLPLNLTPHADSLAVDAHRIGLTFGLTRSTG